MFTLISCLIVHKYSSLIVILFTFMFTILIWIPWKGKLTEFSLVIHYLLFVWDLCFHFVLCLFEITSG